MAQSSADIFPATIYQLPRYLKTNRTAPIQRTMPMPERAPPPEPAAPPAPAAEPAADLTAPAASAAGWTRIPNVWLDFLASPDNGVSLREMRLLLGLMRLTWGFQREEVELTRAQIQSISGYHAATSNRMVNSLTKARLVRVTRRPGRASRFALPPEPAADLAAGGAPRPAANLARGTRSSFSCGGGSEIANENTELGHDFQGLKKTLKKDLDLSLMELPPDWQQHMLGVPASQRERILSGLHDLRTQFPDDTPTLDKAPALAAKHGAPDGQPIRSLMGLLRHSWGACRDYWRQREAAATRTRNRQQGVEQQTADEDAATLAEQARLEATFATLTPDTQDATLRRHAGTLFDLATPRGRQGAMWAWWAKEGQHRAASPPQAAT
jgi:hypothetical protein